MLLDIADVALVSIFSDCYDYIAWNALYEEVFGIGLAHLPPEHRNGLWLLFMRPNLRIPLDQRARLTASVLAHFRFESARHPGDPRFAEIVADLSASCPAFTEAYAQNKVRGAVHRFGQPVLAEHPRLGPISLRTIEMRPLVSPEQLVVFLLPETPHDAAVLKELAADRDTLSAMAPSLPET
jgi:hypothetical protein